MRSRHHLGAVLGIMLVASTIALRLATAQQPDAAAENRPAAPAPAAEPALVMSASVASIDKVAAFAKEVGLGDLPFVSTKFIEDQMPFIGPGGLAGDRPVGLLLYAGPGVDLEKAATFVLPVNPGKAELKTFLDGGAKPVDGRTDLVTLEGLGFRRTADLFVFGQMPSAVAAVREDALSAAYAGGGETLARVDLDVAAVKRAIPERYEQFFATLNDPGRGRGENNEVEQAAAGLVVRPMRAVDRLALTLVRAEGGKLRVGLVAVPFPLPQDPPAKFVRPHFPKATLFRADLAYPPAKAFARLTETVGQLIDLDPAFAARPKSEQELIHALSGELMKLLFAGEAGSLGVEVVAGNPVVYWVTRHSAGAPPDLEAAAKSVAARAQAVEKISKGARHRLVTYARYALGGEQGAAAETMAERLVLFDDGKPVLYLDAVRRNATLLMALAPNDGRYVERLLPLKDAGEAAALASGWLDLSAFAAANLLPDAKESGLGETAVKELKRAVQGQRLAWTISPDGGALRVDLDVPAELLKAVAQAVGLMD